jgi:hypothetical protein
MKGGRWLEATRTLHPASIGRDEPNALRGVVQNRKRLAADLAGTTLGYSTAIGDTLYLVRNTGPGTNTGTLAGIADGGKIDIGGKWWRVSFTSDFGGAGFLTNGAGNDVAIQRIDDPSPSGAAIATVGATTGQLVNLSITWLDNATVETGYKIYQVLDDGSLLLLTTLPANATSFSNTASATPVCGSVNMPVRSARAAACDNSSSVPSV